MQDLVVLDHMVCSKGCQGGAEFDPSAILWLILAEVQYIKLNGKFGSPRPNGFHFAGRFKTCNQQDRIILTPGL